MSKYSVNARMFMHHAYKKTQHIDQSLEVIHGPVSLRLLVLHHQTLNKKAAHEYCDHEFHCHPWIQENVTVFLPPKNGHGPELLQMRVLYRQL